MTDKILAALQKLDAKNDNHWTAGGEPRIDTVRMLAADQTITRDQIVASAPTFNRQNLASAPELPKGEPKQAPATPASAPDAGATIDTSSSAGNGAGTAGVVNAPSGLSPVIAATGAALDDKPVLGVDATTEDIRGEEGVDYHAGVDAEGKPTGVILTGLAPNGEGEVEALANEDIDADAAQSEVDTANEAVSKAQDALISAQRELEKAQNRLAAATDTGRESNPNATREYLDAQKAAQVRKTQSRETLKNLDADVGTLLKDSRPSPLDQSIAAQNAAKRRAPQGGGQ